jgi:hypothetical protein
MPVVEVEVHTVVDLLKFQVLVDRVEVELGLLLRDLHKLQQVKQTLVAEVAEVAAQNLVVPVVEVVL